MKIGINELYQIKQIREITDTSLTTIELDETAENYPFKGWSDTKILCYCYKADENGTSIYPYIDTNLIEKIEMDNAKILQLQSEVESTQEVIDFMLMGGM